MSQESGEPTKSNQSDSDSRQSVKKAVLDIDPWLVVSRPSARDPQYCGALVLAYEISQGRPADIVLNNVCTWRVPGGLACGRTAWWLPQERNLVTSQIEFTPDGEPTESGLSWCYVQTVGCPVLSRCGRPVEEPEENVTEKLGATVDEVVAAEHVEGIETGVATGGLAELPTTKVAVFPPHLDPLATDATKL